MSSSHEYRPFDYIHDPTMEAVTEDGVRLLTTASVLDLLPFTAVPAFVPDTGGRALVDAHEGLEWRCVGTYGEIRSYPDRRRIGEHVPEDVRLEFQDWCNEFVMSHPDSPMIGRTELAYQRNSYKTFQTCYFTYNQLREQCLADLRKHHTGSRARHAQPQPWLDERESAPQPHREWETEDTPGPSTRDVAISPPQPQDTLFDEGGS